MSPNELELIRDLGALGVAVAALGVLRVELRALRRSVDGLHAAVSEMLGRPPRGDV